MVVEMSSRPNGWRRLNESTLIVFMLAAQSLSSACADQVESHYATREDAAKAGAVSRGWIPAAVPESASQLSEKHNMDTGESWGVFALPVDAPTPFAKMDRIGPELAIRHAVRSPHVMWWPEMLTGALDEAALRRSGLEFYAAAPPDQFLLAIDRKGGRGFFWVTTHGYQ